MAGLLVLLYGQGLTRASRLTTDTDSKQTLSLGTTPVELPPPLDDFVRELRRSHRGHFATGRIADSIWLFPGVIPGNSVFAATISRHLVTLGTPVRPGQNAALMDLAHRSPAAVLSQLIGLHIETATSWTTHANGSNH